MSVPVHCVNIFESLAVDTCSEQQAEEDYLLACNSSSCTRVVGKGG